MAELRRVLARIVVAELGAAAFLALDRRPRDRFGNRQQVVQVHRRVPAGVVLAIADDLHFRGTGLELFQSFERALHLVFLAHDADQVLHHVLQVVLHLERASLLCAFERLQSPAGRGFDLIVVESMPAVG